MGRIRNAIVLIVIIIYSLTIGGCNDNIVCKIPKSPSSDTFISVEPLSQFPLYPTGCESVTAVMALNYAGISISVDEFIDEYLICSSNFYKRGNISYGPDPYSVFAGDPRSQYSYGCMAPVIEKALASCLQAYNKQVINCCDTDLDTLCRTYIDNRIPVILWATIDMQVATAGNSWFLDNGELYVWPAGEHCLLLIGYDEHRYYFNDPRYGDIVAYAKTDVEHAYAALGQQALIIQ